MADTKIFSNNVFTENKGLVVPTEPIKMYDKFIRPGDDKKARAKGDECVREFCANIIADFERNKAYCDKHGEENPDLMVHVTTFIIIDGIVYMSYYANTGTVEEDPKFQAARLAYCPLDNPEEMTIIDMQKVGDVLDGRNIDLLYDTILMYDGGDELYVMWTAAPNNEYHRLYRTFNIKTKELGPIGVNRFKVRDVANDFSISGMKAALDYYNIERKDIWCDIGIMQKLTTRIENGIKYYYTGTYAGNFNCIIKSTDFITWEYVAAPDFVNNSLWENATYVIGDKIYYFVRQQECSQGFLTCYNLTSGEWATPTLIADCQSRSDFIIYENELYLIHAPLNREGFGIVRINQTDISKSEVVLVADLKESLFYPYALVYDEDVYMSYTVDRKHVRLSKFNLKKYI